MRGTGDCQATVNKGMEETMHNRFLGLTVVALVTVACGQTGSPSATAPSTLSQPASIAGNTAVIGTRAAHEVGTFAYHIGDALIESLGFPPGNQAMAENGDVLTVIGTGTFDVAARSATGGGTFVHKNSGGMTVGSGTWAATELLTFQSYGNAVPQGLPPTFFGGRVALKVLLTPIANPSVHLPAILQIECALGNTPPSAVEGIRLNGQDVINFNKTVPESGANVYIKE
jgi:hypothetical protein